MSLMPETSTPSRRHLLTAMALALVGGLVFSAPITPEALAGAKTVTVYKSPSCGCCGNWVAYLERRGWSVKVRDVADVTAIKRQADLPTALYACHTAVVDGYVIEGHVPAPAIERLLVDRPDLSGIAVPGMPLDSPGMRGGGVQDVIGFRHGSPTGLYMRARD